MKPTNEEFAKKRYNKPLLRDYGDIRKITRADGVQGALDGGMGLKTKTT